MLYHFHAVDERASFDIEVAELANYEAAVDYSLALASQLLHQEPYSLNPDAWEIRVTDDAGKEILAIPLSEDS
jgi:hypothetical protein